MPATSFPRAFRLAALAQGLLLAAALRHHFVWGERIGAWTPALLNALELALLLAATWLGWRAAVRAADSAGDVAPDALRRATLVLLALACVVPPFLSMDAVNAITRGRILVVHGQNPYLVTADQIAGDPILQMGDAGWASFPLPYGPLIAVLQGAVAGLAELVPVAPHTQLLLGVCLWKFLNAAALYGTAAAASGIAHTLGVGGPRAFVLVAWNPLLLMELVTNAHNDALLAFGVTLAVLATVRGAPAVAGMAACAAVFAKFVPAVVCPALLAAQLPRGGGAVARWLAGALLTAGLLAAPALLLATPGALQVLSKQTELGWQREPWLGLAGLGVEPRAATTLLRAALVAFALGAALVVARTRARPLVLVGAVAAVLLFACGAASPLFGPWYHAWWLPLALCLPPGRWLARAAALVTLCAPASYAVWLGWRRFDGPHGWVQVGVGLVLPIVAAAWLRGRPVGREPA